MRIQRPLLALALSVPFAGCLCAGDPGNLVPETVTEDPSLPAIEVNGIRLHAESFGDPDAPVILVLHSGPGGDYRGLLPLRALADDGYQVVFFDQRGTGLSERVDPDEIDLDRYLADLQGVIDHYAPGRPFVFIGQSWGAMYATAFLDQNGDLGGRIRGAVLTDPGAFTDTQLRAFMQRLQASADLTGEQFEDLFWSGPFLSPDDHARADYQYGLLAVRAAPAEHRDPNNLTPMWRAGAAVAQKFSKLGKQPFDWTQHLDAFQHPVLFLRGSLSEAASLESQEEMAAAYPDARVEEIEGVGHHVVWERPEEYLTHVRAYLREIGFVP